MPSSSDPEDIVVEISAVEQKKKKRKEKKERKKINENNPRDFWDNSKHPNI